MRDDRRQPVRQDSAAWGLVALCGVLYLAWGLTTIGSADELLMEGLGFFLGAILLVTGVLLGLYAYRKGRDASNWPLWPIMSATDLLAALVLLVTIRDWVAPVPLVAGLWALVRGIADGVDALQLRQLGIHRWWAWLVGALAAIVCGLFAWSGLITYAVPITRWLGVAAIAIGAVTLGRSLLQRRGLPRPIEGQEPPEEHQRAA